MLNGKVQPGSTVAIVGAGPIGLAACTACRVHSPAEIIMIDLDRMNRLNVAKPVSAGVTGSGSAPSCSAPCRSQLGPGAGTPRAMLAGCWMPDILPHPARTSALGAKREGIDEIDHARGPHGYYAHLVHERIWRGYFVVST